MRSFRNLVVATTLLMTLLAIGLALTGFFRPTLIPLCFAPEEAGQATIVCPTEQSDRSRSNLPLKVNKTSMSRSNKRLPDRT